jgi:hypothetical protein
MKTMNFSEFEVLREDENNKLVGGFSAVFDGDPQDTIPKVNNCHGGNFKAGCGAHHKYKKLKGNIPNGNCKGNCVSGCGDKK